MNPTPSDGTNTPLQPNVPAGQMQYNYWPVRNVSAGLNEIADTNGHDRYYYFDASNRVTEVTAWTGSQWLASFAAWDANNNLVGQQDPRGNATNASYDAAGNVVAIYAPSQYAGRPRPTTLIDYDEYNNVVAVCDPVESGSIDHQGQSGSPDSYCTALMGSANHVRFTYLAKSYEPYKQLTGITSASGYTRTIAYDPAAQGGVDLGLPTQITGAPITQFDQTTKQPKTAVMYDASGNVVCAQKDSGSGGATATATSVMTYDVLNRLVASADADDASLTGSCGGKVGGIAGSTIVNSTTYYPDGSVATTRSPSEAALGYGTVYSYDLDGNPTSTAPYVSNPQNPQTARMKRWFDGADRLIETQEPADPSTSGDIPISLRYWYDLSQGGATTTTLSGASVTAHGGLFDVVKNAPTGWIDFKYSAYDSLDRLTNDYAFAPCPAQPGGPAGAIYCSQAAYGTRYDWDSSPTLNPGVSAPGLLVASLDGAGASRRMTYDGLNEVDSINYGGDGGATTPVQYAYDLNGRLSDAWNTFSGSPSAPAQNHVAFTYSTDGMLTQKAYEQLGTVVSYGYYADASLARVGALTTASGNTIVNQPNLYRYAYRNDGQLTTESFGVTGQSVAWTYTRGGRMTGMSDFSTSTPSIAAQYADGHGRLSSYQTPSGTYGNIVYDSQGRMTQYTDPYSSIDGETVTSTYDIRGDLVTRTFSGGLASAKPGFQYKNIQGVLVQNASDQYDGRTGALLNNTDSGPLSYDQVGRLLTAGGSGALAYDTESRLVSGDTSNAVSAADANCQSGGAVAPGFPPPSELKYRYDGLGQLYQDQYSVPRGGQPIRQWIWNGSTALYTMPMNSTQFGISGLYGYAADGMGSMPASGSAPGLTISDRDLDGAIAQYHNSTGHSAWSASNPYNEFCQHANPLSASVNYVGPTTNSVPSDGSSDQSLMVSSVGRAYLSRAMGFTTPDFSSATPYSPNGARRGTLSERPATADDSCTSGYRYTDGNKECVPYIGRTKSNPFTSPDPGAADGPSGLPSRGKVLCPRQFVSLSFSAGVIIGAQVSVTFNQDRFYVSVGPYVGITPGGSAALTAGVVFPNKGQTVNDVLSTYGLPFDVGYFLGVSGNTNDSGSAVGLSLTSPTIKGVPGVNLPSIGTGYARTLGPISTPFRLNICDLPSTI